MITGITASTRRSGSGCEDDGILYRKDNGVTIAVMEGVTPFTGWTGFEGECYYVVQNRDDLGQIVELLRDIEGEGEIFIEHEGKQLCLNRVVTTFVTDMSEMFADLGSFNQDIGSWDVSSVTDMSNMFNGATSFNQNLSRWCVSKIKVKPVNFDDNTPAWEKENRQPIWGTCPFGP